MLPPTTAADPPNGWRQVTDRLASRHIEAHFTAPARHRTRRLSRPGDWPAAVAGTTPCSRRLGRLSPAQQRAGTHITAAPRSLTTRTSPEPPLATRPAPARLTHRTNGPGPARPGRSCCTEDSTRFGKVTFPSPYGGQPSIYGSPESAPARNPHAAGRQQDHAETPASVEHADDVDSKAAWPGPAGRPGMRVFTSAQPHGLRPDPIRDDIHAATCCTSQRDRSPAPHAAWPVAISPGTGALHALTDPRPRHDGGIQPSAGRTTCYPREVSAAPTDAGPSLRDCSTPPTCDGHHRRQEPMTRT